MSVRLREGLWLAGAFAWLLLLSIACLMPLPLSGDDQFQWMDKLAHLLMFAAGGFWLGLRLPALATGLALVALGVLIEWLQSLTPYRSAEFLDWLADVLGAGLGLMLARWTLPWLRARA